MPTEDMMSDAAATVAMIPTMFLRMTVCLWRKGGRGPGGGPGDGHGSLILTRTASDAQILNMMRPVIEIVESGT